MQRLTGIAVLLFTILVGTAHAQVATTDLVPAAPTFYHAKATGTNGANITPDNPAALAWGTPSRVAAGALKAKDTDNTTGLSRDASGQFYGVRAVGQTFGFAAEQLKVDDKNAGTNLDKSNDVQLSLAVGSWLALGIGAGKITSDPTAGSGNDISRQEAGISLKLGPLFYVGAGMYKDKVNASALPGIELSRNATLVGIALRTEGPVQWYLAYDSIQLDSFVNLGNPFGGFDTSRFAAQVHAGWFLLGAQSTQVKVLGSNPPTIKSTLVDIGIAPMMGLSVTARYQKANITQPAPAIIDETVATTSVAVAWLF